MIIPTRRGFLGRLFAALAGTLARPRPTRAAIPTAGPDWPVFRHDLALTGVSPGRGKIATPRILWEHYLGVPFVPMATDRPPQPADVADLDGDGRHERFV